MEINDFLVLHQADARNTTLNAGNNTLVFDIPSTYYTNQRSSVCSLSLVDFGFVEDGTDNYLLVYYDNIGQNQFNSSNNGVYLGHAVCRFDANSTYQTPDVEKVEVLVNARPTTISIKVLAEGNSPLGAAITNAFFVLKFKYGNAVDTSELLLEQYTPTL